MILFWMVVIALITLWAASARLLVLVQDIQADKENAMKWTDAIPDQPGTYWEWNFGYPVTVQVYKWTYIPKDNDLPHRQLWATARLWYTPERRLSCQQAHPVPITEYPNKGTKWAGPIPLPTF